MKILRLLALLLLLPACPSSAEGGPDTSTGLDTVDVADIADALDTSDTADSLVDLVEDVADTSDAEDAPSDLVDTRPSDVADVSDADAEPPDTTDAIDAESEVSDVDADGDGDATNPWGPITGEACGTLGAALDSPDPSFHVTSWELVDPFDPALLSPGPLTRFEQPNAGGSSKCSEVFSLQWLVLCEDADLYKIETAIVYDVAGAITDYEVLVDGDKIGVSVTRAYLGPFVQDYSVTQATDLLTKKLEGINESTLNVSAGDAWTKQILHVWTLQPDWVPMLQEAWDGLSADLRADTVVLVTIEAATDYVVTDTCDDAP